MRRALVKPLFADYGSWSHASKVVDHMTRQMAVQSLSKFGIELTREEQASMETHFECGSVRMLCDLGVSCSGI